MTNTHRLVPQLTQEWAMSTLKHPRKLFAIAAEHIRCIAEPMLREYFGDRCPDYEPGCECCRRWKLLDDLTANPYED